MFDREEGAFDVGVEQALILIQIRFFQTRELSDPCIDEKAVEPAEMLAYRFGQALDIGCVGDVPRDRSTVRDGRGRGLESHAPRIGVRYHEKPRIEVVLSTPDRAESGWIA